MTPEKWGAIVIALVPLLLIAGGAGFLVQRRIRDRPYFGWFALALVLPLYTGLFFYFLGTSFYELPVVSGIKAGLLGLIIGIISTRFWRPMPN